MLAYCISKNSTITSEGLDFDHFGNRIYRDDEAFVMAGLTPPTTTLMMDSLIAYEINHALCNLDSGWIEMDEKVGSDKLMVMINTRTFQTFTYCEGDVALVVCSNSKEFARRVAHEHSFYEIYGPSYSIIDTDGEPRIYIHKQKSFIL